MSRTQHHTGRKQKMERRGEGEKKGGKEKEKGSRATRRTAGENGGWCSEKESTATGQAVQLGEGSV